MIKSQNADLLHRTLADMGRVKNNWGKVWHKSHKVNSIQLSKWTFKKKPEKWVSIFVGYDKRAQGTDPSICNMVTVKQNFSWKETLMGKNTCLALGVVFSSCFIIFKSPLWKGPQW